MDYTKRQATAIFDWLMSQIGHEFEIAEEAIANMTEILNSVERPEPVEDERVGIVTLSAVYPKNSHSGYMHEFESDDRIPVGAELFIRPVSAEPVVSKETVNARLLDALTGLLEDITGLVAESDGVVGLHLNGDIAPWDELLPSGRFERLSHVELAQEAIAAAAEQAKPAPEYTGPQVPEGMTMVPTEIIDRFPEINVSNYDHEQVCWLNAWGVELVLAAAPQHAKDERWNPSSSTQQLCI